MDALEEHDDRFFLAPSTMPDAGTGVFARVALAPGDRLEVSGFRIAAGFTADRCTAFADRHKFRVGSILIIPFGYGGMVNHSLTPNMVKVIDGGRVYLEALRVIAPSEELSHAYNASAVARFAR